MSGGPELNPNKKVDKKISTSRDLKHLSTVTVSNS